MIGDTLERLPTGFDRVIVAVNGASDGTAAVARSQRVEVVEIAEQGYGAACLAALEKVQDGVLTFLQADGSEDAGEALRLAEMVSRGETDLAIGSRVASHATSGSLLPHQRWGNWLATTLVRWIYGHRYSDIGPCRAIRADVLRQLAMKERNYGWTIEMQVRAVQAGLRIKEVPVPYGVRRAGVNKVSGNLRASIAAGAIILRTIAALAMRGSSRRVGDRR